MKKGKRNRIFSLITTTVLTAALLVVAPFTAAAGQPNTGINGGQFTDFNTLTWTANDGTDFVYGRGPRFCDVHPEITDPEYFLKGYYQQEGGSWDSPYHMEASTYNEPLANELKAFVHSFDWLHSDELTRANMVHDRISNGCYGNTYEHSPEPFTVLMTGKGVCADFSEEFQYLAKFVGLECEVYTPSYLHQACLLKINGQWFATDPTGTDPFLSNAKTHPVDYQTEKERYGKEVDAEIQKEIDSQSLSGLISEANQKTVQGIITEEDWMKVNPEFSKLDQQLIDKTITPEEYERKNIEIFKSMLGK